MSCDGCLFNTKKAGCDYSYPCNTTKKPVRKIQEAEDSLKREKKRKKKNEQPMAIAI